MRIRKSWLKRGGIAASLVLVVAVVVVSVTMAAGGNGVTIVTPPQVIGPVYIDQNHNGLNDADEYLGVFPIYDGNDEITFSWTPFNFAEGVNGAYRVSLLQNTTPFDAPTWVEHKVAHHFASAGTTFTMGSFGFGEEICTICPSKFLVIPETFTLTQDANGNYVYNYTPVAAALTVGGAGQAAKLTDSEEFFMTLNRPSPEEKPTQEACVGNQTASFCNKECGGNSGCIAECMSIFYLTDSGACGCSVSASDCQVPGDYDAAACACATTR